MLVNSIHALLLAQRAVIALSVIFNSVDATVFALILDLPDAAHVASEIEVSNRPCVAVLRTKIVITCCSYVESCGRWLVIFFDGNVCQIVALLVS